MFRPCILAIFYVGSLSRMLTLQGSLLTRNFAVFFRQCFTPEVRTRTDDHVAQSYSSALFKSTSSLSHCKNSAIASLVKFGRCRQFSSSSLARSSTLQLEPLFRPSFHYTHSFYYYDHTTQLGSVSLLCPPVKWLDMCLPPVAKSSSQQSWCNTRALRMVLRLVSLGYTPSSLAFWPSLSFETSCHGCPSYTAQPASQRLHRSFVSWIGDAAARGAASCEESFFWKRSMDGGDRCEVAEHTIHVQHAKGARSQIRNSQTGILLQYTAYCNKEHSHQNTCSLYTGGNLADTGSLELPPWNPPASWSLPWALHVPSDHYVAAKLYRF